MTYPTPTRNAQASAYPSVVGDPGLTKRELFAAMAMQGLSANGQEQIASKSYEAIAEWSVKQADALIAELAKVQP